MNDRPLHLAKPPADTKRIVAQLAALAQESRLGVLRLLICHQPFGLPAGDIARLLAVPHNTISTHLALLEQSGLVRSRRDGRSIVYACDAAACAELLAVLECDVGMRRTASQPLTPVPLVRETAIGRRPFTVLVVCTANSARSLMAEALINREGKGRFKAWSAGSRPGPQANEAALRLLRDLGYDTAPLHAKSLARFAAVDAAPVDFVVTVCDAAAGEACVNWPGHPLTAHWGIADPVHPGASEGEERIALLAAYRQLALRVTAFVNVEVETLNLGELQSALRAIGRLEGATSLSLELRAA
jgi:arsenate reductase